VIAMSNGFLNVRWADRDSSWVGLSEVFVVHDEDEGADVDGSEEDWEDEAEEDEEEEEEVLRGPEMEQEEEEEGDEEEWETASENDEEQEQEDTDMQNAEVLTSERGQIEAAMARMREREDEESLLVRRIQQHKNTVIANGSAPVSSPRASNRTNPTPNPAHFVATAVSEVFRIAIWVYSLLRLHILRPPPHILNQQPTHPTTQAHHHNTNTSPTNAHGLLAALSPSEHTGVLPRTGPIPLHPTTRTEDQPAPPPGLLIPPVAPTNAPTSQSETTSSPPESPADEEPGVHVGTDGGPSVLDIPRFDVVAGAPPSQHSYASSNESPSNARQFAQTIKREWNILRRNLPAGVYVRVYEEATNLLSALVVGPEGAPYVDSIFVFHLALPPDYPQTAPRVSFLSVGERINPNLYTNGKVCLSLLGTWNGKGVEVWDPQKSTILQVLVSIQGLVLNAKPYFNEAGYESQIGTLEGESNARLYNENAFLLSLRTIPIHLRAPPPPFEELVKAHFRRCGPAIISRCLKMLDTSSGPSCSEPNSDSDRDSDPPFASLPRQYTSMGFRTSLQRLLPRLESALGQGIINSSGS